MLLAAVATSLGSAQPPSRDQQITDIERQLRDLEKKLAELRRVDGTPSPSVPGTIPPDWIKMMTWRSIGPAAMGGRITALSIFEADPSTYWVATASGGLLKTINNGITFEHQFDRESTVSIGDVCVAPSDRNIVWVGTGENNPRNSVSYGDGVYKSTDGGKTWKNMGLKKTFQIGRIVIHPTDPNTVYVGALGRLYGPNEDRGLFKTTDGGQTWHKILFVDNKTGVIEVRMHPADPETLLVATWERRRDEFDSHRGEPQPEDGYDNYDPIQKWGAGSALHKTTDGGQTFKKLTQGLPTCALGRIGIDYYRKNPSTVFVIVDCAKIGMGTPPSNVYLGIQGESAEGGVKLTEITENTPAAKAGLKTGDIIKAMDKKPIKDYTELGNQIGAHKPGDKVTLTIVRTNQTIEIAVTLGNRPDSPQGRGAGQFASGRLLGAFGDDDEKGGVQVSRVIPDSAAAKAGIEEGDVIKALDKKDITGFRQLATVLRDHKAGDKITVRIVRDSATREIAVTLAELPTGGPGGSSRTRPNSFAYSGQRPNAQNDQGPNSFDYGGVYKSTDGGDTWARVNSLNPRPMYFSHIRVDPGDDKFVYVCGISLHGSSNGGKTFTTDGNNGLHPDQHTLWIDPRDGRHMIVGCDGGFYVTYDRTAHWDHLNHLAIGQFYHVALDNRRPYRVYGGLQDNGSWGGPSHALAGRGPINDDWIVLSGGDGFVCRVDPADPDLVYFESQDGNLGRRNLRTGQSAPIRPRPQKGLTAYRFNWNTPFILSSHNARIFYCGGNYVFRSLNQGDNLRVISPEITRTKRGTATVLAESPRNPDVLYAGTDDGYLWITRDGGSNWTNVTSRVGLPGPRWVASVEPSRFVEGRAYAVFDGHRSDDDEPYVFVTEDFGQTWAPLRSNLPTGSTKVLREDVKNANLLFLGNEFGVWVSLNRGVTWSRLNNNLPTVAVHELAIHPTAGEMVAATHGRSLWVLDVTPLRQMTADVLTASAHLYEPNTVVRWRSEPQKGASPYGNGSRHFIGDNPPPTAQIYYSLTTKADQVTLKILDYAGQTVRELQTKKDPGLHRIAWDLMRSTARGADAGPSPDAPAPTRRFGGFRGQPATPGMYRVLLSVNGKEFIQNLRLEADPTLGTSIIVTDQAEPQPQDPSR
jgi:photosystem II stability/assembly factor-like uncharacterized protein